VSDADGGAPLRLRRAAAEDRFRIRRWLSQPDIEAWWGSSAAAEAEISLAMASDTAICRVVERGEAAVGYAQAADIGLCGGAWPEEIAPGTWDVDLFITPAADRGQHLAGAALVLLVEEVFATTLAVACCGLVPVRNETAARAYERAGFRWLRIWHDALLGPAWLMLMDRPAPRRQGR
jgi:aminoglycoside 6'-N-acetyltransferase